MYLENFSISNINIKKLYLKWDNRVNLYIEDLEVIKKNEEESKHNLSQTEISNYVQLLYPIINLFDSIEITHLQYGKVEARLKYASTKPICIEAHSEDFDFKTELKINNNFIVADINQFQNSLLNLHGTVYFDSNNFKSYSLIHALINNDANLSLYSFSDDEKLKYKVVSHKDISNPKAIIQKLPLPQEIHYWVLDAIDLTSLSLLALHGEIDFSNLQNSYKQVHIEASANKLNYTYNPKVDAVHSKYTELEFDQGILYIRPKNATSYNFDLDTSWLKIDFTQPQEILTLFLKFSPTLNEDIIHILNTYRIKLPVKQNSGIVNTDLTLAVNLHSIAVDAEGTFVCNEGNFHYLGQDIDVSNLKLKLKNYDIEINDMSAQYKDMLHSKVNIAYNAKSHEGKVEFNIDKVDLKNYLQLSKKPLHAVYYIHSDQDILSVENSSWIFNKVTPLNIEKLDIPLDITSLTMKFPVTYINAKNLSDGFFSGSVDLKNENGKFDIDLLNFNYSGLKNTQSNTPLKLVYQDKTFLLYSNKDIYLDALNSELKLKNISVKLKDEKLAVNIPQLNFGKYAQTKLYATLNLASQQAKIKLNDLKITSGKTDQAIYQNQQITFNASVKNNEVYIHSMTPDASFFLNDKRWSLRINTLESMYSHSELLQQYHLEKGKVEIYKNNNDKTTFFKAEIAYPYHLLYQNNKPIENFFIDGKLTEKQNVYLKLNDKVTIAIKDDAKIYIKDLDISLPETLKLLESFDNNNSGNNNFKLNLNASNANVYLGDNRYAMADTLKLQYHNKILTAQMRYFQGEAGFKLEGKKFHLYGKNFNDKFMEKLFIFSKFKGGDLQFNIDGSLDHYKGVVLIENSTLRDYTVLNNVLAFINTVPSLVTFSVPGYSKNGLFMNHAYVKFDYENENYNIDEMYMDSKELKISAQGDISTKNDTVDMSMNLKTDIGSNISKIPLVGYIIFDGKAISTSVKINGKLSDPTIKSGIAQEVIEAPINMIKRTIKLPFKIFE